MSLKQDNLLNNFFKEVYARNTFHIFYGLGCRNPKIPFVFKKMETKGIILKKKIEIFFFFSFFKETSIQHLLYNLFIKSLENEVNYININYLFISI